MNFTDLAQKRYSLRKFSDKPVEREVLESILKAGQLAPTALNYQPQRILVMESPDALEKLKACTPFHYNAPLVLLACYDRQRSWTRAEDGFDSGCIDVSLVVSHIMFAAAEAGLGTTFVTGFDPQAVIKAYGVPAQLVPVCLLPMGYPADNAKPSHLHEKRYPFSGYTFYNDFSAWTGE